MAGEELNVVRLKDDFYRDGFYKILIAFALIIAAILALVALSLYLYFSKPAPVTFKADNEWRILAPVPVDKVYLNTPDLIQWVSEALSSVFTYDFINYKKQLSDMAHYFTTNGWQKFLDQVNVYANYNMVQNYKLFMNAEAAGAPFILSQGLLEGRYAWWIQMPLTLNYFTLSKTDQKTIVIQVLVVRVPTENNLYGVGIENFVVVNNNKGGGAAPSNG